MILKALIHIISPYSNNVILICESQIYSLK